LEPAVHSRLPGLDRTAAAGHTDQAVDHRIPAAGV
jgi:hypothetical protein